MTIKNLNMRKNMWLVAAVMVTCMSSCKKEYICECTKANPPQGMDQTYTYDLGKLKESDSRYSCDAAGSQKSPLGYSCEAKMK